MEVIRECDIFNDDSAEIIEVENPKNNKDTTERKWYYVAGSITIKWGGSTPFQFSTKEQKTNLKWLNGKPIYQITFDMGGFTSKTLESVGIANLEEMVGADAIFSGQASDHIYSSITYYTEASDWWYFYIKDNNTIITRGAIGQTIKHIYITLYYTKTTD